jgi:CDP-diacylglycerol--serine O-phosphatidyltransferase
MVDGRVARMFNAQSQMGAELDSLADVVAFGFTPAYLLYRWALHDPSAGLWEPALLFPFVFASCTALRLARFNLGSGADTDFIGLPSPVAALWVTTLVMVSVEMDVPELRRFWVAAAGLVVAGVFMVLPVRFPSFKTFRKKWHAVLFYGAIAGGVTLLLLGGPGGTVLFSMITVLYVGRGLATIPFR